MQAEGLVVLRGERLVLKNLSLSVATGEGLLLVGPNGSGKSTLLRVLAGLRRPDAGTVRWPASEGSRVAYVGHTDALKQGLTPTENLRFAAGGRAPRVALDAFGLTELGDIPARMLSAGQRRRVALARLMLSPAPVWLLDEPSIGLDATSLERLGSVMAAHRRAGGAVVAATHQPLPLADARILDLT